MGSAKDRLRDALEEECSGCEGNRQEEKLSFLRGKCPQCTGRGRILSEEGEALIEWIRAWLPEMPEGTKRTFWDRLFPGDLFLAEKS